MHCTRPTACQNHFKCYVPKPTRPKCLKDFLNCLGCPWSVVGAVVGRLGGRLGSCWKRSGAWTITATKCVQKAKGQQCRKLSFWVLACFAKQKPKGQPCTELSFRFCEGLCVLGASCDPEQVKMLCAQIYAAKTQRGVCVYFLKTYYLCMRGMQGRGIQDAARCRGQNATRSF